VAEIDNERWQDCNHAVLGFLAVRPTAAFSVDAIRSMMRREYGDYKAIEIMDALEFLKGKGFITEVRDTLDVIPSWKATSDGVQHWRANG